MSWTQEQVWTAAAYAYRVNGGFVPSSGSFNYDTMMPVPSNKSLILEALEKDTNVFTEEDVNLGKKAFDLISTEIMIKSLKGSIGGFEKAIADALAMTEITRRTSAVGIIASQIKSYFAILKKHESDCNIRPEAGYLAEINEKTMANIRILRSSYSSNYNTFFINGISDKGQLVLFSFRQGLEVDSSITITGKVTAWMKNDDNFPLTKLNRVKVVKNKD